MISTKVMKNGTINLPAKIRKSLNLKPGDKINFIKTKTGYIIVPVVNIFDLIDPQSKELTIELIEEVHQERRRSRSEEHTSELQSH